MEGARSGPGVVIGVGLGIGENDPAGVGEPGVPNARGEDNPEEEGDAARCFAFTCRRRWCCGLSRR